MLDAIDGDTRTDRQPLRDRVVTLEPNDGRERTAFPSRHLSDLEAPVVGPEGGEAGPGSAKSAAASGVINASI